MQKIRYLLLISISTITLNSFSQEYTWIGNEIDLNYMETRIDSFNMVQEGKIVGYWIWETKKRESEIVFKDVSVLTNVVNEEFTAKFDIKKMNSVFVDMKMWTDKDTLKVDITRNTNKDILAKFDVRGRTYRQTMIDTSYIENVILRPEIFGMLSTLSNFENLDETLNVFFMSSGIVTTMNLKYLGEAVVTVPAGVINTYKIVFQGENQVSNIIYIRKKLPQRIVKVEVIGSPLMMELIKL